MGADVALGLLAECPAALRALVQSGHGLGKCLRLVFYQKNILYLRNSLRSGIPSLPTEVVTMGAPL